MQLLLNIADDNVLEGYPYVIKREEREGIDREYGLRPEDDVKVVNIGPGADWMVLLTTISTAAWELFKLPGTISDAQPQLPRIHLLDRLQDSSLKRQVHWQNPRVGNL